MSKAFLFAMGCFVTGLVTGTIALYHHHWFSGISDVAAGLLTGFSVLFVPADAWKVGLAPMSVPHPQSQEVFMIYLGYTIFTLFLLVGIWILNVQLRTTHASSVYLTWYVFSLVGFTTELLLSALLSAGLIDPRGNSINPLGKLIMQGIVACAVPMEECKWLLALVGLIVVPQWMSYLLSGLSGCAMRPRFVSLCANFLSLSFAKTFSFASGVLFGITLLEVWGRLQGVDTIKVLQYVVATLALLAFSFLSLAAKMTWEEWPMIANQPSMAGVRQVLVRLNRWMTRHSQIVADEP